MQMESLVEWERDREYARLLAFLGLLDDTGMRDYFSSLVTPQRAHIGRWRDDVPAERLARFEAHHRRLAEGLLKRGRPYVADGMASGV